MPAHYARNQLAAHNALARYYHNPTGRPSVPQAGSPRN